MTDFMTSSFLLLRIRCHGNVGSCITRDWLYFPFDLPLETNCRHHPHIRSPDLAKLNIIFLSFC